MMQTLNKMKEKLEKESNEHKNVKQQVAELTARLHELSTVCCPPYLSCQFTIMIEIGKRCSRAVIQVDELCKIPPSKGAFYIF